MFMAIITNVFQRSGGYRYCKDDMYLRDIYIAAQSSPSLNFFRPRTQRGGVI